MNKYTIIEDCSPYYIRFTHDNIQEIINLCKSELSKISTTSKSFERYELDTEQSKKLLSLLPMVDKLSIREERCSLFVTPPGYYYRAHKDGIDNRVSLNYAVQILDDECVTSWYSDEDLKDYSLEGLRWTSRSREAKGFDKSKHTPIKSMVAQPNECVLFNTDIFHDFDNTKSNNVRAILTLRVRNPGIHYFDVVKKTLFDI